MATINIPDDPTWRRLFNAMNRMAARRGRINRECEITITAGKSGVRLVVTEEEFTPDE